jgi:hypothetical protein
MRSERVVVARHLHDGEQRPERLEAHHVGLFGHVDEHRGLEEAPLALHVERATAGEHAAPAAHGVGHLRGKERGVPGLRERAERGARRARDRRARRPS